MTFYAYFIIHHKAHFTNTKEKNKIKTQSAISKDSMEFTEKIIRAHLI
jgi:hypothetical protein